MQRHMSESILEELVHFILKLQVQNVELITLLDSHTSKESIGQREKSQWKIENMELNNNKEMTWQKVEDAATA